MERLILQRALNPKFKKLALLALVFLALSAARAQRAESGGDSQQELGRVTVQAREHPHSYDFLKELTDSIGPRLTGTAQDARAGQWALQTMRGIGLQNVHAEPWQLERGWRRGFAHAQMLVPYPLELTAASYGWTGSTRKGGAEAEVVSVASNDLEEETRKNSAKWAGKILLVGSGDSTRRNFLKEISEYPAFLSAAMKAGAVAVIKRSSRPGIMLPHTDPVTFPVHPVMLPVLDIAAEQEEMISRVLNSGAIVRVRLEVQNEFSPGEVTSNNIVGEIPGADFPEQIVALGAHLDSWDLGTGAVDDGFGVAAVLGAAKSIIDSGVKPKRTIRIILFTGEEQGLLGSRAYTRAHHEEMKNFICAIVLDWGSGPITKYLVGGHDEFAGPLGEMFRQTSDFGSLDTGNGFLTYTDAYAFVFAGVAGITPFQNSPNYSLVGHSAADTLDKVDPTILARDSGALALSGLWIANYPNRIGTIWPPAKTAQMLEEQRAALQTFGLWPFQP
jgi:carboxypeptidase Q